MVYFSEGNLVAFSKSISNTEDSNYQSTIRMVEAVLNDLDYHIEKENDMGNPSATLFTFAKSNTDCITLLVQGSYANDTCVKADSDVDIAVIYESAFKYEIPSSADRSAYGFSNSSFDLAVFKNEVFQTLANRYGSSVSRKNKSIYIKGNSSRKDCDVVPCLRYRDYKILNSLNTNVFASGICILSDKNERIINYPEIHYENERSKNEQTQRRFKKFVRIFKCMANDLEESNKRPQSVSSFKIECALFNVSNSLFNNNFFGVSPYTQLTRDICKELYFGDLKNLKESNQIKTLFNSDIEIDEFKQFLNSVWNRLSS